MKKRNWIIAACCSEGESIDFLRFQGTDEEVKEKIADMVTKDSTEGEFESGSTSVKDMEVNAQGEIRAYACFKDFHIDYAAIQVN